MAKLYTEVASRYDHITLILPPEQNIDVKKAQGGGSYKGTVLTFKNKDGDVESTKMAQAWLDNKYQATLKGFISLMEVGKQYTIVKVKTVDMTKEDYEALEDKKGTGNWGVKQILEGHVIPEGMGRPAAAPSVAGKAYEPFDIASVEMLHAMNGAMRFLGGKATVENIIETAKSVHDITIALKKEYAAANPSLTNKEVGNRSGNAVLNAIDIAVARKKALTDVPDIARKWLKEVVPAVAEHVKPTPKPEAKPEVAPDVKEDVVEAAPVNDIDDIPF